MNTRSLLDQLLRSGQEMLADKSSKPGTGGALGGLTDLLGKAKGASSSGGGLGGMLSGAGGGALAASAMGLLMGSKGARKLGGKALTYGGLAALGVIAYKAYGNWQARQGAGTTEAPRTLDRVPAEEAEQHSEAILRALVAAAKADGHIDDRERALLEGEFKRLDDDQSLQHWLHDELNKPLDPADVARAARTPEIAAEMYLASLMMVDQENYMERAYLDELCRQLRLDPALRHELDQQARAEA